jgi:hypothetical protein
MYIYVVKNKAIGIRGGGRPFGSETLMLPHFLENRLIDSG